MGRTIRIAAAQMGATHLNSPRPETLDRMLKLLDSAASQKAQMVLFPETAFTTFFPRHLINDPAELDSFFEHGDIITQPQTAPLFTKAKELGIDIAVGFGEKTDEGETFNSCVYYHAESGSILSKYRKIHLPGDFEPFANPKATNQLEKRYFLPGNLGFNAFRVPGLLSTEANGDRGDPIFGMMICNDRRWFEGWRVLGLQGVEVVLCGYNTAGYAPEMWGFGADATLEEAETEALFLHKLVMQAGSNTNACWSVSAARCGMDDGKYDLIAGSCIVDPLGHIVAEAKTKGDEIVIADCDLEKCRPGKERTFDFKRHRRVEHYKRIIGQTGVIEPPKLDPNQHITTNGTTNGLSSGHTATKKSNGPPYSAPTSTTTASIPPAVSKQIRILIINPNATSSMTESCVSLARTQLPSDVSVSGFTCPHPGPTAIEGAFDNIASAYCSMKALLPDAQNYDAFLVACYSDHALIKMLREEFTQPVIGIMEASFFAARTLGGRVGVIATSQRSRLGLEDAVRYYGFADSCVGVEACDLGVLDLHEKPQKEVMATMAAVGKSLVEKGADTLTLGCAGMTPLKEAVEHAVGEDVQVIDGVLAGVHHLTGVVRMGSRTAKKGLYKSSKITREARGQDYY